MEIVNDLMSKASTSKGLKVVSSIMDKVFEKGRKYSEDFKENMQIIFDDFLGQWNYRVVPSIKI